MRFLVQSATVGLGDLLRQIRDRYELKSAPGCANQRALIVEARAPTPLLQSQKTFAAKDGTKKVNEPVNHQTCSGRKQAQQVNRKVLKFV